jgi:hypothetical protein
MTNELDELVELVCLFPGAKRCEEGGAVFYYIPILPLPIGCIPAQTEALLCPTPRDGYPSRLYFAQQVQGPVKLNWNTTCRILERTWYAFSWSGVPGGQLKKLIWAYVRALLP